MATTWQTATIRVDQPLDGDPTKLRELASWYRERSERTGNATIWEARLLTAEDLDAKAERIESVRASCPLTNAIRTLTLAHKCRRQSQRRNAPTLHRSGPYVRRVIGSG
jgi:hypothetical protein